MAENEEWPEDKDEMVVEEPVNEQVAEEKPAEEPKKKFSFFSKKDKPEQAEEPKEIKPEVKEEKKPLFAKKPAEPGEPGFIKKRLIAWKRTLEVSKKPTKEEFKESARVTGIGISILGLVGFIIFIIYHIIVS